MTCKCGSERIMSLYLYGHGSDCYNWDIPHLDHEGYGYAPYIPQVCGGDDIDITFCLDCGQIQNFKPITDDYLKEILDIEDPEGRSKL